MGRDRRSTDIRQRSEGAVSGKADVEAFLARAAAVSGGPGSGRLLFALDATASREPTWIEACRLQHAMFDAVAGIGGLSVRLAFYRGHDELKVSRWLDDAAALRDAMSRVDCVGGFTQIARLLRHAADAHRVQPIQAMVFVGDACEEPVDAVSHAAGQLGLLGLPVFVFHEGDDPQAGRAFRQIARLSRGAYSPFDLGSADLLRRLLGAVAVYASGGRRALNDYAARQGEAVRLLAAQLG